MVERSKLLRIYGPELCQEEAVAVEGMLRMLFYQKNVRSQFPFENGELKTLDEAFENLTCEEFDDVASEIASTADNQESLQDYTSSGVKFENATKQTQEKAIYSGETDVYLPPFVGRLLEQMRSAKTLHGNELSLLLN